MKIKILNDKLKPEHLQPSTIGSAGLDLRYLGNTAIEVKSRELHKIHTGIAIQLDSDSVGLVFPRSSTGCKGLVLANTIPVIDSDYRGEIILPFMFLGEVSYTIQPMDRIAQLVVTKIEQPIYELVQELDDTERGTGGFGSTGK